MCVWGSCPGDDPQMESVGVFSVMVSSNVLYISTIFIIHIHIKINRCVGQKYHQFKIHIPKCVVGKSGL